MATIVAVHGIAQQFKGPSVLHAEWFPPLRDGLLLEGVGPETPYDLACAFYGDLFRPRGAKGVGLIPYQAGDVEEGDEQELLEAWWHEAARVEAGKVPGPGEVKKGLGSKVAQRALNALSHSRFFASVAEKFEEWVIADLKQVTTYFRDAIAAEKIRERVEKEVGPDTRVIVGHSLGSAVAYECLCAHPEWPVRTFVTIGSPLGIRNLVFDRLNPAPVDGRGAWPGSVRNWINIADANDLVALVKDLGGCFGEKVTDVRIDNGADAHNVLPYLTARETGRAIASGLR